MDLLIQSAEAIAAVPAETYITGHEAGIVSQKDFQMGIRKFLDVIEKRDEAILAALAEPCSLADICARGLIYGRKFLIDEWVRAWDALTIKRHLDHLAKRNMIKCSDGMYLSI